MRAVAWMLKLNQLLLQMSQKKRKEDGFILDHDKGKSLKNQMLLLKIPSAHALSLSFEDYKNPENAIISNVQRQHYKKDVLR